MESVMLMGLESVPPHHVDLFASSDAVRSGAALRYLQQVTFDGPIQLERGGTLPAVTVAYETYGQLNAAGDNAVLICHALSGDSHVAAHDEQDTPGWWDILVGPGKMLDTRRYFVICPNILGSCRGTTGPNSIDPRTGHHYGSDFPLITVGDMVETQRMLIDHLGISKLRAVIGGSLGGQQALTWATHHPQRLSACITLATSPRLTSQALAFDVVGRNAILRDPNFHSGQYYHQPHGPEVGLALARMLGHITYLSQEAMTEKFDVARLQPRDIATEFEKKFSVGSYLAYQGHKFVERFDANSYVAITMAMDLFDLGDTPQKLREALAPTLCRWLVLSFSSDWLFPPFQSRQIVDALIAQGKSVSYCNVASSCGHDAFLLPDNLAVYGQMIQDFLQQVSTNDRPAATMVTGTSQDARSHSPVSSVPLNDPTSIFHGNRLDHHKIIQMIAPEIPKDADVLDVGCGNGDLLELLRRRGHRRLMGVEIDEQQVLACVARGLDVIQLDLEQGLSAFPDDSFDLVVLSQTLQSVPDTPKAVAEIVRVGRRAIVSFPNFAYHKLRKMLFEEGRSPKSSGPYRYEWYNTPNRRFPSIADFQDFCRDQKVKIHQQVYLDSESGRQIEDNPNYWADMAIVVISR